MSVYILITVKVGCKVDLLLYMDDMLLAHKDEKPFEIRIWHERLRRYKKNSWHGY